MTWRARRMARKVQRRRDERNDYWHWLWYARLGLSPSRVRKAEERLAKLDARLEAMLDEQERQTER